MSCILHDRVRAHTSFRRTIVSLRVDQNTASVAAFPPAILSIWHGTRQLTHDGLPLLPSGTKTSCGPSVKHLLKSLKLPPHLQASASCLA